MKFLGFENFEATQYISRQCYSNLLMFKEVVSCFEISDFGPFGYYDKDNAVLKLSAGIVSFELQNFAVDTPAGELILGRIVFLYHDKVADKRMPIAAFPFNSDGLIYKSDKRDVNFYGSPGLKISPNGIQEIVCGLNACIVRYNSAQMEK